MNIEALFVPGVIGVMSLFAIVLAATSWLSRN
jgi:hypothetical protein